MGKQRNTSTRAASRRSDKSQRVALITEPNSTQTIAVEDFAAIYVSQKYGLKLSTARAVVILAGLGRAA